MSMKLRLVALLSVLAPTFLTVLPASAQSVALPSCRNSSGFVECVPVILTSSDARVWTDGTIAQDVRAFGLAEVQVTGLSGGDTISFTRSLTCTGTYLPLTGYYDQNGGGAYATVAADNIVLLRGGGCLKNTKTGSASTPTITIRAAQ